MMWETPRATEIKMDAEISAYQEDPLGPPNTPVVLPEVPERTEAVTQPSRP